MDTNTRLLRLLNSTPAQQAEIDRILSGQPRAEPVSGPLLMNMSEAARYLGISRASLWRACKAKRLTKVELFPNSYRLRRADVEALAAGRKEGDDEAPPK
jgi:excisionase family DNA binding protein